MSGELLQQRIIEVAQGRGINDLVAYGVAILIVVASMAFGAWLLLRRLVSRVMPDTGPQ